MRFRAAHIIIATIALWVLLCGNRHAVEQPGHTHVFGLTLTTGMNNQVFTLFTVKMHGMHVIQAEPMTREQFVLQAQGVVPSKANPEQENLFRKFKIKSCAHPDTTKYYLDCPLLDDLWRLRFGEYPFHVMDGGHPGKGWAGKKGSPTPMQMVMLADYGLLNLSGLIKGIDVFRLLHDVGDSTWVASYQGGS